MYNLKNISLRQRSALPFLIFLLILLPVCAEEITKQPATVLNVIDGDTIKVIYQQKKESLRLIGIDAPENIENQRAKLQAKEQKASVAEIIALGRRSTKYTQTLVKKGDTIYIEFDVQQRDQYGRLLGYVYLKDGKMLNLELLKNGYASPLTVPPTVKYKKVFLKAYREARENKRGLWQGKDNG